MKEFVQVKSFARIEYACVICLPLILINSFDNDDMKSSKRHVVLVSLIFLLKCSSKSCFIKYFFNLHLLTLLLPFLSD